MNFSDLRQELADRGFDDLSNTRLGSFVNSGYRDVAQYQGVEWPWFESTATGAAPLVLSDVRKIHRVVNTDSRDWLTSRTLNRILECDPGLQDTGTPAFWYLSAGTTVNVWPTSSVNVAVYYTALPVLLTSDTDEPEIPEIYRPLIVDAAAVRAYRDADNTEEAALVLQGWTADMDEMLRALAAPNMHSQEYIDVYGGDS